MLDSPVAEYAARRAARAKAHDELDRADARLSHARLLIFGAGVALALIVWRSMVPAWTLAIPIAAFIVAAARHDHAIRAKLAMARAVAFYERGLARVEDRWIGGGETGDRFRDDDHLYANDLDLFGRGSLFELLSTARTSPGEETLAAWLKAAAVPEAIHARQTAVRELAPALDLRERLWVAATDVRTAVDAHAVAAWATGPGHRAYGRARTLAFVLTAALLAAVGVWLAGGTAAPLLIAIVLQLAYAARYRDAIERALHDAADNARELDVLGCVLARIESGSFEASTLRGLRERLDADGATRASPAIARLHRLIERHDWSHNLVFAPIAIALMWDTHIAWAVEAWRERYGSRVPGWLDVVGQFEAIASLAAYHYEHPADPFPEVIASARTAESASGDRASGSAVFDGAGLGHPLLAASRMVRNDITIDARTPLVVISGSNMSGKSTLLRTVGINAVLAFAGAPVRAERLRLTSMAIGATLRIQDSLQEGRSRFYAEITRIRQIAELARDEVPLLFLLDEIFHGTNSHDRLVGATGVLLGLIERGAIGLVTTHDLALTAIADGLDGRAANVHFDDRFEGGELRFDYRMKPGPVTRSNAIALMRAVGLDVP